MSRSHSPEIQRPAVVKHRDASIRILVEDEDGPVSPNLSPREFQELWKAVRANADNIYNTTEDSTQDISNAEGESHGDRKRKVRTHERDPNFTSTNLRNVPDIAREDSQLTRDDSENLDHYIPEKIVRLARDQWQDCIRRGDTGGAREVLESATNTLREQFEKHGQHDPTPWKTAMVEILIDQGESMAAGMILSEISSQNRRHTDATLNHKEISELRKVAELKLDLCRRAGVWSKVQEAGQELYDIHPRYFDLDEPMDRFTQIRRVLNIGVLKEVDAVEAENITDLSSCEQHLTRALEIYSYGCHASESYHQPVDTDIAIMSDFDHPDCANIFFSAARVCHRFDSMKTDAMPRDLSCKGPRLTCVDWKHQALYFLEKGRARALLDTIIRHAAEEVRRPPTASFADIVDTILMDRGSAITVPQHESLSSPPSTSIGAQALSQTWLELNPRRHFRAHSAPSGQPGRSAYQKNDHKSLKLQTDGLPGLSGSSLPNSPFDAMISSGVRVASPMTRAQTNWRTSLLWAITQLRTSPSLAKIPSDTLVVEFALASTSPCGIMIIIAATDAVQAMHWRATDPAEIQNCIGDLRESLETSHDQRGGARQNNSKDECAVRPSESSRISCDTKRKDHATLFWDAVVAPVRPHLTEKKKLVIVPSGDLAHVPWRIFFDLPITVVPSLGIWVRFQKQATSEASCQPSLSVVSTAPEDKQRKINNEPAIRDIPFSRVEALYIARLHMQSPILADEKTREDLQELVKDTQILHICAHSNFDSEHPMSSSLQLFEEPFTVSDWLKSSIRAELVVFSSCLSGISRAYDSGSTLGFAHTLLGTGTKAFIGSLWNVDDKATLLLMTMFYQGLRKPLSPVDALYEAQTRMRNMTKEDLRGIVDTLEIALCGRDTKKYVIYKKHWLRVLRETDAVEWRQEKYWAAFVLTGYGSNTIYPPVNEDTQETRCSVHT